MDMSYRHEDALASVRREIAAIRKPHDEIADRTVVVTKDPDNEVAELVVREVQYLIAPPIPCKEQGNSTICSLGWYGVPFNAYPSIGRKTTDYEDFVWDSADVPGSDATFLKCVRAHDVWVVEFPIVVSRSFVIDNFNSFGDYLICRTWNGSDSGNVLIEVAKPYLLRRTPFHGQSRLGIAYQYTSPVTRTATRDATTESQVVNPSFANGDVIYAELPIGGGTGVIAESGKAIRWLDKNLDARAWAKVG